MPRRLNTIIIVPHNKAKFLKLSLSTRTLVLSAVGVALALALSIVAILYSGAAVSRSAQVKRLAAENRELADVNLQLEQTVSEVQARLDEFEQRTARLALAAGMETGLAEGADADDNRTERAGRGGPYDRVPESPDRLDLQGRWIDGQLDRVEQHLDEQARRFGSTPTIAPVMGIITDGFGRRRDPFTGRQAFHRGLDLAARRGTPVIATADGVVVFSGRDGGFGRVVKLSHGFGYITVFGHLEKILVHPGDEVRRGDTIGLLGSSGRSTGPHLHYEVHVDGRAVNPLYYILDAF
jgi:murein DD-endopeptidase MepM/ murein hydrolase activator NlpD